MNDPIILNKVCHYESFFANNIMCKSLFQDKVFLGLLIVLGSFLLWFLIKFALETQSTTLTNRGKEE